MTAFEKSLRGFDEEALRAGAEELLALLAEADGGQRGAAGRVSALADTDVSQEKSVDASVSGVTVPEAARGRRAYLETDGGDLAEQAFPGEAAGRERGERKSREDREARADLDDREAPESLQNRKSREDPEDRTEREDREMQTRTLLTEDGEAVDRTEMQALEKRLQRLSGQRRGMARQSGEDGTSDAYAAAFRGPERQYEGAVGARGTEMRRISDYFRRDSRRYDTGFTTY